MTIKYSRQSKKHMLMQSDNLSILCVELCNQLLVLPTFNCLFKNIRLGKRSACADIILVGYPRQGLLLGFPVRLEMLTIIVRTVGSRLVSLVAF